MRNALNQSEKQELEGTSGTAKCVWMLAGVVDYKLCDRDYDCEGCPLDQALGYGSQTHHSRQRTARADEARLSAFKHEPTLFYHPAHVWARIEDEGSVRIGLDDFGQSLAGRIYSVHLPDERSTVSGGEACWRIAHYAGETVLASPVSGTILQVNPKLAAHPSLINRDPYGEGWALVIQPARLEQCLKQLYYGNKVEQWYQDDIQRLYQAVNDALRGSPAIGVTMQDGGSPIHDSISLLTAEQMRRVIDDFLSVPFTGAARRRGESTKGGDLWSRCL
jgi:glycine cleavage system H lipoate-binding protein